MSDLPPVIDYIGNIEPRGQLIPAADFPALYKWVKECSLKYRERVEQKQFTFPDLSGIHIDDKAV